MKSHEELFDRYVDGELTPGELAELETWIAQDPQHAKQFLEWSATHLDTRTALQSDTLRDAVAKSAFPNLDPEVNQSGTGWMNAGFNAQSTRYIFVALSAVLLTAVSLFLLQAWRTSNVEQDRASTLVKDVNENAVAKIIQRIDCVMQQERWNATSPIPLAYQPGESVLVSEGLVIIEFDSGAQVTLEGPADLEILSANAGFLREGKLTAVVPESAIGFEVLTPNSRVIDLGTEFGVSVDESGNSETHVFSGEVELITDKGPETASTKKQGKIPNEAAQRLTTAMAARVSSELGPKTISIPASPQDFIRIPKSIDRRQTEMAGVSAIPEKQNLAMWFESSQGVQLDGKSRIISWRNLADAGDSASSAWQVNAEQRPLWQPKKFGTQPAIRFGGYFSKEFLATTPIQTGNDISLLMVCSFGKTEGKGYGNILHLGRHAQLVLVRRDSNFLGADSYSWKKDRRPHFLSVKIGADSVFPDDTPVVCGYRYGHGSNTFQLYANGQLLSEGDAFNPISDDASRIIGGNIDPAKKGFFKGSIAEIVMYDRLLDPDTFDEAMSALMQKYTITANDSSPREAVQNKD